MHLFSYHWSLWKHLKCLILNAWDRQIDKWKDKANSWVTLRLIKQLIVFVYIPRHNAVNLLLCSFHLGYCYKFSFSTFCNSNCCIWCNRSNRYLKHAIQCNCRSAILLVAHTTKPQMTSKSKRQNLELRVFILHFVSRISVSTSTYALGYNISFVINVELFNTNLQQAQNFVNYETIRKVHPCPHGRDV